MKFNAKDLDLEFLKARAFKEAEYIMRSPDKRRGRSDLRIKEDCLFGQAAECYLLQCEGFTDDSREYKDVKDRNRKPVEVKVISYPQAIGKLLERVNLSAKQRYKQYARKLYVFVGNRITADYYLYGTYSYNGTEFVKD